MGRRFTGYCHCGVKSAHCHNFYGLRKQGFMLTLQLKMLSLIAGVRPLIVSCREEDVEHKVSVICFYCKKNGAYCAAKVASLVVARDEWMNQWR